MKRPNNAELFKNIVLDKIRIYCDTNIWPFKFDKFAAWLNNFECEVEEYLALQLLDNLVVRSNEMAKSSYSRLIHGPLRQHLNEHTSVTTHSINDWQNKLEDGSLNSKLRVYPAKLKGDSGDSSEIIYRMLSESINTDRYSKRSHSEKLEVMIFVDDFIGSGKQFETFAAENNLSDTLQKFHVIYCPLIAFETGIEHIKKLYPTLHILPAEYIYKSDSLFFGSDSAPFKNDNDNSIGSFKKKFEDMHNKYAKSMKNWYGYDDASLPLAFEWGCPNQAPAILFMKYAKSFPNWQQLFSRRS